mgnify:CR=1 FL=1
MFELIGCPMHCGVPDIGKGLCEGTDTLNRLFPELRIRKIPEILCDEGAERPNLKMLQSVIATCEAIAREENAVKQRGNIPVFIGGDHACGLGTVGGSAATEERLGLIWVDAHSDINTDVSTISGRIHGMPVSALMGYGEPSLCSIFGEEPKILPQDVVLFGVRDMDPLEVEIVERLNIACYSYEEIQANGLAASLEKAVRHFRHTSRLHISFDLDAMDPEQIPGVTVPVPSGFSEEDIFSIFGYLLGHCNVASMDIVEFNPLNDIENRTADFVRRLIHKICKA